jgi:hypothetical protein
MHANKHEFGRAITPVSAINGAQRTARPTTPPQTIQQLLHGSVATLAAAEFFDGGE